MKLTRVKRLLKIREFELKQVQSQYAVVLSELSQLEREIERMEKYRNRLREELFSLQRNRQGFKAEEMQGLYRFVVFVERRLFSLERQKQDTESYLERLRQIMLERKKEKDIVDKIKAKVELDELRQAVEKERKEADEKATQQFGQLR